MQEGGVVKFKATDDKPAVMPARANRAGEGYAHVTWPEPLEGIKRLLTALLSRVSVSPGLASRSPAADPRLLN